MDKGRINKSSREKPPCRASQVKETNISSSQVTLNNMDQSISVIVDELSKHLEGKIPASIYQIEIVAVLQQIDIQELCLIIISKVPEAYIQKIVKRYLLKIQKNSNKNTKKQTVDFLEYIRYFTIDKRNSKKNKKIKDDINIYVGVSIVISQNIHILWRNRTTPLVINFLYATESRLDKIDLLMKDAYDCVYLNTDQIKQTNNAYKGKSAIDCIGVLFRQFTQEIDDSFDIITIIYQRRNNNNNDIIHISADIANSLPQNPLICKYSTLTYLSKANTNSADISNLLQTKTNGLIVFTYIYYSSNNVKGYLLSSNGSCHCMNRIRKQEFCEKHENLFTKKYNFKKISDANQQKFDQYYESYPDQDHEKLINYVQKMVDEEGRAREYCVARCLKNKFNAQFLKCNEQNYDDDDDADCRESDDYINVKTTVMKKFGEGSRAKLNVFCTEEQIEKLGKKIVEASLFSNKKILYQYFDHSVALHIVSGDAIECEFRSSGELLVFNILNLDLHVKYDNDDNEYIVYCVFVPNTYLAGNKNFWKLKVMDFFFVSNNNAEMYDKLPRSSRKNVKYIEQMNAYLNIDRNELKHELEVNWDRLVIKYNKCANEKKYDNVLDLNKVNKTNVIDNFCKANNDGNSWIQGLNIERRKWWIGQKLLNHYDEIGITFRYASNIKQWQIKKISTNIVSENNEARLANPQLDPIHNALFGNNNFNVANDDEKDEEKQVELMRIAKQGAIKLGVMHSESGIIGHYHWNGGHLYHIFVPTLIGRVFHAYLLKVEMIYDINGNFSGSFRVCSESKEIMDMILMNTGCYLTL